MEFQILNIEFDFDDAYPEELDDTYKQQVIDDHIGMIVEADDEDDLIDEITSSTGWCILSIDYRTINK